MSRTDDGHLLVGVGDAAWGMSELAQRLGATPFAAEALALRDAIQRAQATGERIGVIVPSRNPELILLAAMLEVDRLAVLHGPGGPLSSRTESLLRASLAAVDLTLADGEGMARQIIALGADPDRLAPVDKDVKERLFTEPKRRSRAKALAEIAFSLGLDVAQGAGAIGLLEKVLGRGVHVINYHRVLPLDELQTYCRPQMAIGALVFEAQLETLSKTRGFVEPQKVRDPTANDRVAITFDDGYEDNFRVALPILERYSAHACIFVVTNLIDQPDALWWDRVGLSLFAWWKDGAKAAIPPELPTRTATLTETRSSLEARQIISAILSDLNQVSLSERDLATKAAESLVPRRAVNRTMLSWQEVEALSAAGVSFGSHTRNHVPLDELELKEAEAELKGAQEDLEAHKKAKSWRATALPRGRLGPLTEAQLRAEFDYVMTTEPGSNDTSDPSLFVKRRDGRMLTLQGRHHPAKLRLELTGIFDRLRSLASGGGDY